MSLFVRLLKSSLGLTGGLGIIAGLSLSASVVADEKKEAPKEPPGILMSVPLTISPGETGSLILRGLKLDQVTSIQMIEPGNTPEITIVRKEMSAPPDKVEAADAGNTLAEVKFTLPEGFTGSTVAMTATTPDGVSLPFQLTVIPKSQLIAEAEPNDSLRKPQQIQDGFFISGVIGQPKDVDVYEFSGNAGMTVVARVLAAELHSPCDGQLTLFNSAGQILKIVDDQDRNRDPLLRISLPATDSYRLVVVDSTDRGSALHAYLLRIQLE